MSQAPSRYYELSFAKDAYEARVAVIAQQVPPGCAVLDLGCNDGRIACHLLRTGRASRVLAIDSQDLIEDKPPALSFMRADIRDIDFQTFEPIDLVLALNVAHHLVRNSRSDARAMIQAALGIAPAVILEMGSFTEVGPWRWRRKLTEYWRDDQAMWDDLFGAAPREMIHRYPAMGGGHRVIWRLQGRAAPCARTGTRL